MDLLITRYGTVAGRKGRRLILSRNGTEILRTVPLELVTSLTLLTGCHLTASLQTYCYQRGIPVSYLNRAGALRCLTAWPPAGHVRLRRRQYTVFRVRDRCRVLARAVVGAKLHNGWRLLREKEVVSLRPAYRRALAGAASAPTRESLRGLEGTAGRWYFAHLRELIPSWAGFERRVKRRPRDPANAMLSFLYSRLYQVLVGQLTTLGLDPYLGFYHQVSPGHAALASDLMEPFRVELVDRVVLRGLRQRIFRPEHFQQRDGRAVFTREGYRRVLGAFRERLLTTRTVEGEVLTWLELVRRDCRDLVCALVDREHEFRPWRR
jgi:CRISPR-associated protein Cas1